MRLGASLTFHPWVKGQERSEKRAQPAMPRSPAADAPGAVGAPRLSLAKGSKSEGANPQG